MDRIVDRGPPGPPASLYVHVPFCEHMCLFCGGNVAITRRSDRRDNYLDSVEREYGTVAASGMARLARSSRKMSVVKGKRRRGKPSTVPQPPSHRRQQFRRTASLMLLLV